MREVGEMHGGMGGYTLLTYWIVGNMDWMVVMDRGRRI